MEAHPEQFEEPQHWTVEDSSALYMIDRWGAGYFGVNGDGDLTVAPLQENGIAIPIIGALREAQALNLNTPILIRFQDLLRHRVEGLNKAFNRAIAEHSYRGTYRGVFPIKVNQLREVVEEILDSGKPFNYGLEVGSKPEVYAGL
ncbi:MAG TPA: arginine decarboxylase, partial [Thermoanaerobaculia bacterium]